jgi:hypothetical protein
MTRFAACSFIDAPNNVPSSTACQTKIANALNSNLQPNTNVMFLGPTAIPPGQMDPRLGPGGRNGAYNFNYFAPGVNNPVAGSTNGSGRFPGSGLHVPLPGGADPVIPNFGPGVYMGRVAQVWSPPIEWVPQVSRLRPGIPAISLTTSSAPTPMTRKGIPQNWMTARRRAVFITP